MSFTIDQENHGYLIMVNKLWERFIKKELQMTNQAVFRIGKVRKRKDDKLFLKRKGYDNSYKS